MKLISDFNAFLTRQILQYANPSKGGKFYLSFHTYGKLWHNKENCAEKIISQVIVVIYFSLIAAPNPHTDHNDQSKKNTLLFVL